MILDELNGRRVDGEVGDSNLAAKEQGRDLDADVEFLGLDEWRGAECGIVGNGDVVGDQLAAEEGKRKMVERNPAPDQAGQLFFNCRPEGVGVDEEGNDDKDQDEESDDADSDL